MSLEPHQLSSGLSDMTRLRILALLQNRGELCVCQIVSSLDIPQPKVSKHLAILKNSRIIRPGKIDLVFEKPIPISGYSRDNIKELMEKTRNVFLQYVD